MGVTPKCWLTPKSWLLLANLLAFEHFQTKSTSKSYHLYKKFNVTHLPLFTKPIVYTTVKVVLVGFHVILVKFFVAIDNFCEKTTKLFATGL